MFLLVLEAMIKLGLPVLLLTWVVYAWLYREGKLEIHATRRDVDASLKAMKKNRKSVKQEHNNFLLDKWLWMGGGFYGLTALWTLFVVEILDFFKFLANFSDFIKLLQEGPGAVISTLITNQIANLVSAFLWFTYWADGISFTWIIIAYFGYLAGIQLAKQYQNPKLTPWF